MSGSKTRSSLVGQLETVASTPQFYLYRTFNFRLQGATLEFKVHGGTRMTIQAKPDIYRDIIDSLVDMCHTGQGQIDAHRIRRGVWNENARPDYIEDQYEINLLLSRLSKDDREVLAKMVTGAVETGVFETLKSLEQYQIEPFTSGYEGSPIHDFVGRLQDWEWPNK
jgi:hypothetical protein